MKRIDSFQSTAMKRKGEKPTFSLWEKVATAGPGPEKTIFGTVAYVPTGTAAWGHVKGAPFFDTLDQAKDTWPWADVSPYCAETAK